MGTKRPSLNPFDIFNPSNQSASDRNPQPNSQISRETSPRPETMARTDRERERIREQEWRREREMERLKDKTRNRRKEMEPGPRERNREKDCAHISRGREEEREWRERGRGRAGERRANGRPTSNMEIGNDRDREKERKKGDTFPRMTRNSNERDRRMSAFVEEDVGKEGTRQLERQKGTEMDDREREREKAAQIQRYRDAERDLQRYRERERIRAKEEGEKNGGRPMDDKTVRRREREREADPDFRERRRERDSKGNDLWSKRERYMDGERERPKLWQGEREVRGREGDSQNYSDRECRDGRREGNREGQRDTRSEGDSDGEKWKERVRDDNRRELKHLHSKSEGDNEGNAAWDRVREKEKERQKWRGGEMYRERDGGRDAYRQRVRDGGRNRDGERDMEKYRERDRRKAREVERERDGVREGGRREDGPRERRDPEKEREGTQPNVTGKRGKQMDGERFRERDRYYKGEDEERRRREKRDRETDPKREGGADRGSRSQSETVPRVPPQVQSSGEWSSDIELERNWRRGRNSHEEKESEGEKDVDRGQRERSDRVKGREGREEETKRPEQRKMWLEPQRVRYNKDSSVEDEVIERERDRHTNRCRERSEEEDRSMEQRTGREKERKTEGDGQEDRSAEQTMSINGERETEREGGRERYLERGTGGETEIELNVDEDDETEAWRRSDSRGEEHQTYSDGEREERWQRDRETERENVTEGDREEEGGSDRYAHSEREGGSEREREGERDRIPSYEDGFITVSSGGEEEFEDCKEFLEVGVAHHVARQPVGFQGSEGEMERGGGRRHEREREITEERTEQKEDAVEGEVNDGKGKKQPTYVFCVIGQTLPRSIPNQTEVLGDVESEPTNQNPGYGHDSSDITHLPHDDPSRDGDQGAEDERKRVREEIHVPNEERTDTEESSIVDVSHATLKRESEERLKVMEENPYAEIDRRRNSETEKLLKEWRERHKEYTDTRERDPTDRRRTEPEMGPSSHPSGGYHQHGISVVDQVTSDQNNPGVMSPEEAVAFQIRISGAWSTEEEAKRHSQASHMKWAKNVLSEILGSSEEHALGDPQPEPQGGQEVSQTERGTERVEEEIEEEKDETPEGGGASPVYATVHKQTKCGRKSVEAQLSEREAEPGKVEDERGTWEKLADMHAEALNAMLGDGAPTDTHAAITLDTTHGDTPTDRQGEEVEGNNVCTDRQTDSHIHIQVEMVTEDEGEMEKGGEVGDEVHILDAEKEAHAQKEEDLFLSVSNTLYKPTSCPSLIYNPDSEQPITTIEENMEEEGEKERTVGEGEENSVVEGKQERRIEDGAEDWGKLGEVTEERKLEGESEKREGGEEGKEESKTTGGGGVKSTCSFQDLGTDVRYRRRGFRKTTERRNEEEEEGGGVARDRRTRIFHASVDDEEEVSFNWGDVDLRNVTNTIGMARRNSKFYNSQLYQQYSETAQNREILSQSCSDTLSIYEELPVPLSPVPSSLAPSLPPARRPLPCLPPVIHPHSLSHSGSTSSGTSAKFLPLPQPPQARPATPAPPARPSSPRLSISLTQSPSLWQEIPEVRNSAKFGELTEDQRRLQEVQFEVVTSEASYCRSLDIVVDHFVKSKQLGELLTTQDRNWLFSRLADVRAISHSFLLKLEERVESDMMHFTVCDIIARHCQRFKKVYVPYLTNQSYQDATYQRLMDENQGFRRVVEKLERSAVCQRLPLRSFLILPFQRITRIKLLVQNIVKRTAQDTEEEVQAIKAMKLLERLIQESNDSITQMKSIESLVSLSARVDFECRTLPLVSQSRRLVREGPVTEMMDFSLRETERSVYLHLFNDYLLLSLHKEGGRFTVIDHAPVSELRAENCRVKLHSLQKNLFRLYLNKKALLLSTDTQGDKLRWISAVSRPHPVIDYSAAQDFTQMQCIRAFVAHQSDELSLEKAEVILVHQQSSDGWVEGTRLSDRHRGWTPESHLETIASLRVRQRNLLDALKITTATAAI